MLVTMFYTMNSALIALIVIGFALAGKMSKWENSLTSSFECGFSSYFFSRYSFSLHFFLVSLIFLFLDLELCFVMPFFMEEFPSFNTFFNSMLFILILIFGVIYEWKEGLLDWKF